MTRFKTLTHCSWLQAFATFSLASASSSKLSPPWPYSEIVQNIINKWNHADLAREPDASSLGHPNPTVSKALRMSFAATMSESDGDADAPTKTILMASQIFRPIANF